MRLPFRILVLEDDPDARARLVDLLRDANYLVTGAATTDAAKRLLALGSYDLLITDGPLRALNGRMIGRQAEIEAPEMALMIVAPSDDGTLAAEAKRFGAQLLEGPLQESLFLRSVRQCLHHVRRRRRWIRKRVTGGFRVLAHGVAAAVIDVCYGGLRIEVANVSHLPDAFDVEIAGIGLHLQVENVWMTRSADGLVLICGAALAADSTPAARTWRAIVDRLTA